MRYQSNPEINEHKYWHQERKYRIPQKISKHEASEMSRKQKSSDKVDNFLQQEKQSLYYICKICHRSLYQCSQKLIDENL